MDFEQLKAFTNNEIEPYLQYIEMWQCITALGIKPFKDGNQWSFLYGDNIQEDICGFGDTIDRAAWDFYTNLKSEKTMKELLIEEKAKAYDGNYKTYTELINRLEDVKDAIKKQNLGIAIDILYKPYPEYQITASPELKESEDERIKKRIIEWIEEIRKCNPNNAEHNGDCSEAIAWLEKQGEHDVYKESFNDGYKLGYIEASENIQEEPEKYGLCKIEKQDEQKPADEVGNYDHKEVLQTIINAQNPVWSEEDEKIFKAIHNSVDVECLSKNGLDYVVMVDWLKSLKDRVQPQPKQEWSEEDKRILNSIIQATENHCFINLQERNWLKSLRPQKQWKPSEEQMKAINHAIQVFAQSPYMNENDYLFNMFKGLKKDLEQLKAL